ncbi:MAG: AccI family restriction endonuclease, partial [Candidatus Aenigmatarchaeota archaeon]
VPVKYGRSEKIIAGDPLFKKFYEAYQNELDKIGKRPDILIFNPNDYDIAWGEDISSYSLDDLSPIVKKAVAGFEVRSSAYLTGKFKPKDDKPFLSFTPKIEDLLAVLKWIDIFNVPHYYVQVFFDAIFIIPFKDILILLKNAKKVERGRKNKKIIGYIKDTPAFVIEKNPKNQFKETIHIFLNNGFILHKGELNPILKASKKELASGRLLHYVTFDGGNVNLDKGCLMSLIQKPV